MKTFKVGDRVRVTSPFPESSAHGLVGTVTYVEHGRRFPYAVAIPGEHDYDGVSFTAAELELVTPAPGKRVITVTLKAGSSYTTAAYPFGTTFTFTGDVDVETEYLTRYVQVKVQGKLNRFTYRDTSGTLKVGDTVEVPFGMSNRPYVATVVELGRGSYTGPVKDVAAKLTREEIAA